MRSEWVIKIIGKKTWEIDTHKIFQREDGQEEAASHLSNELMQKHSTARVRDSKESRIAKSYNGQKVWRAMIAHVFKGHSI